MEGRDTQLSERYGPRADPLDSSGTFHRTYSIRSWIQISLLAVCPGRTKLDLLLFSLCCKGGRGDGGIGSGLGHN